MSQRVEDKLDDKVADILRRTSYAVDAGVIAERLGKRRGHINDVLRRLERRGIAAPDVKVGRDQLWRSA